MGLLYTEMNAFALSVLALVLINLRKADMYFIEQKLFMTLSICNAAILILDTATYLLNGKTGSFARLVCYVSMGFYYLLGPMICALWSLYVDHQVFKDENRFKKLLAPMLIPFFVNAVLTFLSFFGNCLFYFDEENVYHRGHLYWLAVALGSVYLMYSVALVLLNKNRIEKRQFYSLLLFFIPPLVGQGVQSMFYGIPATWTCMTLSVLIIFLYIQNTQLYTDHLTGLFNRRQLDHYVEEKLSQGNDSEGAFAGIMVDLDGFKNINDVHGHLSGDMALEYAAEILKDTFRKNDFIARTGGDEFIIILQLADEISLDRAVGRLQEKIGDFNRKMALPFEIKLSIGYDLYDNRKGMPVTEFFKHIDRLMYEDKLRKKAAFPEA
jgi:diguanylate cyclase (GGDEF)-like protein